MSKKSPTNKPVAETYQHVYEGKVQEVAVSVHINYAEGTISLCDHNPANPSAIQAKQWKFAKRELEYMQGWHDILDAMKSAITDATKRLQDYQLPYRQSNGSSPSASLSTSRAGTTSSMR